jgi:hypothetical protein
VKQRFAVGTTVFAGLAMAAQLSLAHHSLSGQFDDKHPVVVSGVITKVDWVNPHIYVELKAKDTTAPSGVATWRLEAVPVAIARKAGLSKAILLGTGETVTVQAFPARDGTPHLGFMMKLTYPDGRYFQFVPDKL